MCLYLSYLVCYSGLINDKYYKDEPIFNLRPTHIKKQLKPPFKKEFEYFSPKLLNKEPTPSGRERYYLYFYMESYYTSNIETNGGKSVRYLFLFHGQQTLIKFLFLWVYSYFSTEERADLKAREVLNKQSQQLYKKHALERQVLKRLAIIDKNK